MLHRVLPQGLAFPLVYGFIPGTIVEDRDPLDILVFAEEPFPPGSKTEARLLGVIEAAQRVEDKMKRNDRLVAVARHKGDQMALRNLREEARKTIEAVETFFVAYNALDEIEFKPLGAKGAVVAQRLIQQGREHFEKADE